REGRTPLVVLTADRPPELRDRGAPQTIDQDHLYGRQVKWYAELPAPEESAASDVLERHLRGVVDRAVAIALDQPSGPVHLNLPYREPLVPAGDLRARQTPDAWGGDAGAFVGVVAGRRRLVSESLEELAA